MKGLEDDKNIEEDWPLKDVVFVEDQKSLPIGIDILYIIIIICKHLNIYLIKFIKVVLFMSTVLMLQLNFHVFQKMSQEYFLKKKILLHLQMKM